MDRFFFDRPNTMVKKVILVKRLSIKYILPFSSIPQLLLQYEEKFFQQVWNEKLLMFIYTQKCNFFFNCWISFFPPGFFVQYWTQFLLMPCGCFEWSGIQLWNNKTKIYIRHSTTISLMKENFYLNHRRQRQTDPKAMDPQERHLHWLSRNYKKRAFKIFSLQLPT